MIVTVHNRNIRISPRKVRPVLHNMRGQTALKARDSLKFTDRKAAGFLYELVKSGIAAAKENYLEADQVMVKEVFCNEAPRLKRAMAWSKGQSRRITKRGSHITLILESVEDTRHKIQETNKVQIPKNQNSKVNLEKTKTRE